MLVSKWRKAPLCCRLPLTTAYDFVNSADLVTQLFCKIPDGLTNTTDHRQAILFINSVYPAREHAYVQIPITGLPAQQAAVRSRDVIPVHWRSQRAAFGIHPRPGGNGGFSPLA